MRRLVLSVLGVAIISVSPPVAAGFGFCKTTVPNSLSVNTSWGSLTPQYVSAVLDFGENYAAVESAARQFGAAYGTGPNRGECDRSYSRAGLAEEARARLLAVTQVRNIDTGWTGGLAAKTPGAADTRTPSGVPAVAGGGGSLTVEDNGNLARIAAWDNKLLQAQRVEAAAKVQRAIGTAESKAEYKRLMDKVRADLKRRGRAQ